MHGGIQSSSVNIVKVLPSPLFNGNLSEWTLTTRAPRSLQQELSMVSFLVQIVTIVPHSCRTLTVKKNQCWIESSCPELQSNIWLFTWVAYKSFINTLRFNTATIELSIPAPRRITDGLPRQWVGAIGRNFGRDPLSLPLLLLRDPLSPIGHNFRFPLICLSLCTPTHERRNGLPKF